MSFQDERPKERFIPNPKARLGEQFREVMRIKHYALRTEQTYWSWIRQYIFFHQKRHPRELGTAEIQAFLTHLAVERKVSSSTQNQALNALVFLYQEVWPHPLPCALVRKYPHAGHEWAWQWVFPSAKLSTDPRSGRVRRHPVPEVGLQRAVKEAVRLAGIHKPAS